MVLVVLHIVNISVYRLLDTISAVRLIVSKWFWLLKLYPTSKFENFKRRRHVYFSTYLITLIFTLLYTFQPTHKMQSASGAPVIQLHLVPKMLAPLVNLWVPEAYVVSFKLETDESLLIPKARAALEKYKHKV